MVGLTGVPEYHSEQVAILLGQIKFRMQSCNQTGLQILGRSEEFTAQTLLLGLNILVVSLDQSFFAGEVIVSGTLNNARMSRDGLHRGGIESTLPEKLKSARKDLFASLLALVRCQLILDHGQIMRSRVTAVNNYLNEVKSVPADRMNHRLRKAMRCGVVAARSLAGELQAPIPMDELAKTLR